MRLAESTKSRRIASGERLLSGAAKRRPSASGRHLFQEQRHFPKQEIFRPAVSRPDDDAFG
jgi:hypothetical protein